MTALAPQFGRECQNSKWLTIRKKINYTPKAHYIYQENHVLKNIFEENKRDYQQNLRIEKAS